MRTHTTITTPPSVKPLMKFPGFHTVVTFEAPPTRGVIDGLRLSNLTKHRFGCMTKSNRKLMG